MLLVTRTVARTAAFAGFQRLSYHTHATTPQDLYPMHSAADPSAAITSSPSLLTRSSATTHHRATRPKFPSTTSRFLSSTTPDDNTSNSSAISIKSIDWLRETVLHALNELFDPVEVARGAALAKLQKKSARSKKSKQPSQSNQVTTQLSTEEIQRLVDQAAATAKPYFTIEDTMVSTATRADFGDFQINAAMGIAKALNKNPRECAQQIIDKILPSIGPYMEEPEMAGPGFINLRFNQRYLTSVVGQMASDVTGRLGIPQHGDETKQTIVVDYSSPNIAKEMHVGHLRSTIIGDTLCNLFEFAGHTVVRLNHIGDWGTQFGMLVEHLRDEYPEALNIETSQNIHLGDLVELYKAAKKRFDVDVAFRERAREGVVKLQSGNKEEMAAWEALCAASRLEYQKIYDLLQIHGLQERGESFYNPFLVDVVEELKSKGLAVESEGATAIFLDGYVTRDGTPLPMLIRKSDGGFNYAATDLAAIRHRVQIPTEEGGEKANRVLYVVDAGQSQHFEMVFKAAKLAGFVPEGVSLEHVPFGLVQGADGKKFATRSGDTIKLKDLLNESIHYAAEDLRTYDMNQNATEEHIQRVAKIVGVGSVKYADLSMNRQSNYRFSYERMLSLNGNTAPYMLYVYARICGIIRKATGQENMDTLIWPEASSNIVITDDTELQLVRALVRLPDILAEVERDLYPNKMCDYLFETSQIFNKFYESCSVNNAPTPEIKASRLSLCTATAGTIRLLMKILGIDVVERM